MRATARLVAAADAAGRTRLTVLRGEAPLLLRRTGSDPDGTVQVHLVGGAAGPLGGDLLRLDIDVGAGAALRVRAVAATLALPGPSGAASRLDVVARVADGASLTWTPEPLIAARDCAHVSLSTVDIAAGARLVWRDELVCGRTGEDPGDARQHTDVRLDGRPLYVHELAVGPRAPGWDGPAVLGGARAVGALLVVDGTDPPPGAMALAGPAWLGLATGADAGAVRARLDGFSAVRALPVPV